MRCETVAERVRRRSLHYTGVPDGHVYGSLDCLLVDMMALDGAGSRVLREPVSRKHILPTPFPIGIGVFACQRMRQVHPPIAGGEVLLVKHPDTLQMVAHCRMENFRKQRNTILFPLPIAHAHLLQTEIDILHAQTEPLDQTQAAAIQELSD